MMTGEDQHIEKKTLDDYYGYIRMGSGPGRPYNFHENREQLMKCLRQYCMQAKGGAEAAGKTKEVEKDREEFKGTITDVFQTCRQPDRAEKVVSESNQAALI